MRIVTYRCDACNAVTDAPLTIQLTDGSNYRAETGLALCPECSDQFLNNLPQLLRKLRPQTKKAPEPEPVDNAPRVQTVGLDMVDICSKEQAAPKPATPTKKPTAVIKSGKRIDFDIKRAQELRAQGLSFEKIGLELGCAPQTVINHLKKQEETHAD